MKTKIATLLLAGLSLCGCATQSLGTDLVKFVSGLPSNSVTDASLQVSTPLWSHNVSVTGMGKASDGSIIVTNLKDNFSIPLWGTTKTFSVSGLTITPSKPVAVPAPVVAAVK